MDFKQLETTLENKGFDTAIKDGVLAASKERGDSALEITIDSGGGCLVKKKTVSKSGSKTVQMFSRGVRVSVKEQKTAQFRTYVGIPADLDEILKALEKI